MLQFYYINFRQVRGVGNLVLYRVSNGTYTVTVFNEKGGGVDVNFPTCSQAKAYRENIRPH